MIAASWLFATGAVVPAAPLLRGVVEMSMNDESDAGMPVAMSAADVASVVETYRRAEDAAAMLRHVLADFGLPHSERDVVSSVDARGDPVVRILAPTPQHRRSVMLALSDLLTRAASDESDRPTGRERPASA
jgi:hypothetical protein